MKNPLIDTQLDRIEQQLSALSDVLLDGNPSRVHMACGALQQLVVDLLQIADEVKRSSLREGNRMHRIQALSKALQPLREGLLRRYAYVERALEIVMPAAQDPTYASGARYGGAMRQSGAFRVLSA